MAGLARARRARRLLARRPLTRHAHSAVTAQNPSTRVQAAAPRSPPPADGSLSSRQQDILAKLGDAAPAGQPTTGEQPATGTSRRQLFNAGATVLGACMCGVCGASPVRAAAPGDWGYTPKPIIIQQAGPYAWGATCAVGNAQSPVDLPFSKQPCATKDIREEPVKRITTRYRETERCCITNAGHGTMQVRAPRARARRACGDGMRCALLRHRASAPPCRARWSLALRRAYVMLRRRARSA